MPTTRRLYLTLLLLFPITVHCQIKARGKGKSKGGKGGKKSSSKPAVLVKSSKSLSCDFEDGSFCNWRQETHDEFNWTLGQGPTSSEETGPETDHTKLDDTGHYAFIEASAPAEVQDMAVLTFEACKRS